MLALGISLTNPASGQDTGSGRQTYSTICVACHTVGEGRRIGPDRPVSTKDISTAF